MQTVVMDYLHRILVTSDFILVLFYSVMKWLDVSNTIVIIGRLVITGMLVMKIGHNRKVGYNSKVRLISLHYYTPYRPTC